jgi:hypothetical protein
LSPKAFEALTGSPPSAFALWSTRSFAHAAGRNGEAGVGGTCRRHIGAMARVTFRVIAGKDGDRCAKRSAVRRKSPADSGAETRVSMKRERNYTQSRHPSVR